jgi:hypothetical protein
MSCENLVCANCAGRVVDACCPVCREARTQLHHHSHFPLRPELLAVLLLVLLVLTVFAHSW